MKGWKLKVWVEMLVELTWLKFIFIVLVVDRSFGRLTVVLDVDRSLAVDLVPDDLAVCLRSRIFFAQDQ